MTLPSSGPLTLADIQTEFGGSNPISLSEYYAGGAYVPAGTTGTYGAVPSSGTISIRNFYGTSSVIISITNQYISYSTGGFGAAIVSYRLTNGGKVQEGKQTTFSDLEQWCTPTSAAGNYQARVSNVTGVTPSGTIGAWVSLSSTQTWSINSGLSNIATTSFLVEIRRTGTTTVLDSATITLVADGRP